MRVPAAFEKFVRLISRCESLTGAECTTRDESVGSVESLSGSNLVFFRLERTIENSPAFKSSFKFSVQSAGEFRPQPETAASADSDDDFQQLT